MADVELVIKIPEEQYNAIKSDLYNTFSAEIKKWGLEAIRNGTPLSKGHGRLIDADVIWDAYHTNDYDFYEALDDADTIIEADKEIQNE